MRKSAHPKNSKSDVHLEMGDAKERTELHSHFRFDQLFTRLTMEPFAEKPIDNLTSISFCTYRVRSE